MRLAYLLLTSVLASACATTADPELDEIEVGEDDTGKAEADSELRVRAGDTSIWMTRDLTRRETADGPMFVLRGRASLAHSGQ